MRQVPPKRPLSVILVVLFQLLKAAFYFFLFRLAWRFYGAWATSNAASGYTSAQLSIGYGFICVILAIAIGLFILALGLWNLQKWARNWLLFIIPLTWLGGGGFSLNAPLFGESILGDRWSGRTLISVFFLDLMVYCCLAVYPDIAKAFGEKDESNLFS